MTMSRPFLRQLLQANMRLVICGTAPGRTSAHKRIYYAGRGNRFWSTLHTVGLTDRQLTPEEFERLPEYGIGLTDLIPTESGMDQDIETGEYSADEFRKTIEQFSPGILAFNGKKAARLALGRLTGAIQYGQQVEAWANTTIWVLPSTSGAASRYWDVEVWKGLGRELEAT